MAHKPDNTGTGQSALIEALMKSSAYPHPVTSIKLVETHISWVILTGTFAYKIKKAVRLDFLDFSSLERRHYFCDEELRLNRRWAPELYLDVIPICGTVGRPIVGGRKGRPVEYALKMLQFPQEAQLDEQLHAGLLHERDMVSLAETIARYHDQAKVIEYSNDRESVGKVRAPMLENFSPLRQAIDMDLLSRVQQWTVNSLRELKPRLIRRRKDGFVRECHGDLHLANLVRLPDGIVAFDCVEFSPELRNIDVISDVAFLVMDLVAHARQDLAYVLLNRYLERTGDYSGMDVFNLYFVYHCMIRAKVAAIRSVERAEVEDREEDIEALKHNLAVAARWIDASPPKLIGMHGYSASGKTWVSSQLMSELPAIRVRSDIERKRLFGLEETGRSDSRPGGGIYTDRARTEVYDLLLSIAARLLDAGFNVIIDASFLRRADRQSLTSLAEGRGLFCGLVSTDADRAVLASRLRARRSGGEAVSEADASVLEHQYAHADHLDSAERARTVLVETDSATDPGQIIKSLRRLEG